MERNRDVAASAIWPLVFIVCLGWLAWYFPRFIIALGWANDNLNSQYRTAGAIDYLMAAGVLVAVFMGVRTEKAGRGELAPENALDRLSLFLGRVTMFLIVILVAVMFYEVCLRYVFERPTLWANELSLWLAGFVFLLSGLYAMQQRSHIRIFLLYDMLPRSLQRVCDTISALLIVIFAVAIVWGGWNEARDKFLRWETFGTAFDPPLPATIKPTVLLIICLVAIQAIVNLIADWNKAPEVHGVVDETEIDDIVESARHQHEAGRHD